MTRKGALVAGIGLAGCATPAPPADGPVPGGGAYVCHAENLSSFIGQQATQALGAEMLRASGARTLRWVAHGMMITMEFSPERLTVFLTADNRVERASCT